MVNKRIDIGNGIIQFYNEQDQWHREDGPALEYQSGEKYWWINGLRHRVDGPAIECSDGYIRYYIMGKKYSYEDWLAVKDFPLLW